MPFGNNTAIYASSMVSNFPLRGAKYFSTKSSCATAVICANASTVVPKPLAVDGIN